MTITCNHALTSIVDVFTQYFDILCPILLQDLYAQLQWCIQQGTIENLSDFSIGLLIHYLYFVDNDQLAQSSTYCLENLITSNGSKFDKENWDCTCQTIVSMFDSMMPRPTQEQNSQSEVCILLLLIVKTNNTTNNFFTFNNHSYGSCSIAVC